MSPVNSDDAARVAFGGADRPLTRKEIRAREKGQETQSHYVVPPQAFETGGEPPAHAPAGFRAEVPDAVRPEAPGPVAAQPLAAQPVTARPPAAQQAGVRREVPPLPDHAPEPAAPAGREAPVHDVPVQDTPVYDVPVDEEPVYEVPVQDVPGHAVPPHGYEFHYQSASDDGYAGHPGDGSAPGPESGTTGIPAAKVSAKKIRRRRFAALVLTLALFFIAVVVGAQFLKPLLGGERIQDYPGPGTGQVTITVPEGAGPKAVAISLQEKNVIADADAFLKAFIAAGGALSPGDFTMRLEMKNSDAVAVLQNKDKGKVLYIALNAGLRLGESLQAISEGTGIPLAELKALSDAPAQFGLPSQAKNLEGFLAPGEFRFPLGTPAKDIIQVLVNTTLDELKSQGVTDPAKQYEAVIVASIVQAEGGQAEYGDVAGAIYNRLKPGNTETYGLIQSDATVTYGLGIRSFHIDEAQKADKSNPYNTYANPGLPAGPIGSPGKTAIDAAANPRVNDYLYWVTINLDTKETKFSKTLAEHNSYVALYNDWCNKNPGRCV